MISRIAGLRKQETTFLKANKRPKNPLLDSFTYAGLSTVWIEREALQWAKVPEATHYPQDRIGRLEVHGSYQRNTGKFKKNTFCLLYQLSSFPRKPSTTYN